MTPENRIALFIDGGIGDHISCTPMLRGMKAKYPDYKLGVIGSHGDVFLNNPNIDLLANEKNPGLFYQDFAKNAKICKRERIEKTRVGTGLIDKHIYQAWCDLYNVPYDGKNAEVFLTEAEETQARIFLSRFNKPVVLIQHTCGQITNNRSWFKEEAEKVIDALKDKIDFIQVDLGEGLKGVEHRIPEVGTRNLIALMKHCKTFVVLDSFWQHASRCFNKRGVVLWGSSNPKNTGYDHNINIYHKDVCEDQPCWRPEGCFMDFGVRKKAEDKLEYWQCPDVKCMKEIRGEEVIQALGEILKENNI